MPWLAGFAPAPHESHQYIDTGKFADAAVTAPRHQQSAPNGRVRGYVPESVAAYSASRRCSWFLAGKKTNTMVAPIRTAMTPAR